MSVNQDGIKYQFLIFDRTRPGIETRSPWQLDEHSTLLVNDYIYKIYIYTKYIYTYLCVRVYKSKHVHIDTYTHTHTHTHTHIYIYIR